MDSYTDLGVIRLSSGSYSGHCQAMVTKATKIAGAIRRVFGTEGMNCYEWPFNLTSYLR